MKKSIIAVCASLLAGVITAVSLCVWALRSPQTVFAGEVRELTVVLDAGHGGIDGGVSGRQTRVKESDINLAITLQLQERLTEMGFAVVLTRKTEAGLYDTTAKGFKRRDMQKRKEIIQSENPAFLISVHQNYYPSVATRGAQVFFSKNNERGQRFANALQNNLNALYAKEGVKARKITAGDFFILKCTENPSVIVECGFLSNAKDERLLCSAPWQKQLAQSIADGLTEYLSAYTA